MNFGDLKLWADNTWIVGTDITHWLLAVAVALVTYGLATGALSVLKRRLEKRAPKTRTRVDDSALQVLGATSHALIALAAVLVAANLLAVPDRLHARLEQAWFIAVALQFALWGTSAVRLLVDRYVTRHAPASGAHASATATLMSWGLRTLLWAVVLLAVLSNLGVNISALVASLGIGGVAVALAVQNVLGDLFASLSIAVDKPFEVGDFIVFGDVAGSVEAVGLKSTRIRALSGEQVVASNTDLLKQVIHNFKRQSERRIQFGFGVTYGISAEQAARVAEIVRRIIESRPKLRFDRAHFKGFGESSLDYEAVYIVREADYNLYMDEQQAINLALMRELAAAGIEFASPTRTVVIANGAELALRPPVEQPEQRH
jgi:small-conductance mechanosensitive channel